MTPDTATLPVTQCDQCNAQEILENIENGQEPITDHIVITTQEGCKHLLAKCEKVDMICDSIQLYAKTANDTVDIGYYSWMPGATLSCTQDGKWESGIVNDIESVYCDFVGCK
ncbi:hypothetical protein GCK72_007628 [Caenorhabditis remanei]|uniref:DUF281 domain-containing protein n=1 Tax=Caenorhabditis remanei TaxID=31234 RepID=A0A6A5HJJ6_CAERE|nr:hypothetical protein GCK72_007628 [Caenorhabditis remanei]KAF1767669.1 hypothetical protein GCK72_007628 [Caenorhabditis remanei]